MTPLAAGTLLLAGFPGAPLTVLPSASGEEGGYSTPLPTLDGGTLRVKGLGGANVSGFETEVTVPPPVQVTTSLAPGTVIDYHSPFTVNWTGGNPDTRVQVRLIANRDDEGIIGTDCTCQALANAGTAKVDVFNPTGNELILQIARRSENVEVVLTVTPLTSKVTRFTAPGLTREGRHEWSYEYHFKGLKIR